MSSNYCSSGTLSMRKSTKRRTTSASIEILLWSENFGTGCYLDKTTDAIKQLRPQKYSVVRMSNGIDWFPKYQIGTNVRKLKKTINSYKITAISNRNWGHLPDKPLTWATQQRMTSAISIFQFSQMTGALVRRTIGPEYFCPAHNWFGVLLSGALVRCTIGQAYFIPAHFCPAHFWSFEAKMSTGRHRTLLAVAAEVDHDASKLNLIRNVDRNDFVINTEQNVEPDPSDCRIEQPSIVGGNWPVAHNIRDGERRRPTKISLWGC